MRRINREWQIEVYRKKKSQFKTTKTRLVRREKQRYRKKSALFHKVSDFRKKPYIFVPFMGKIRITGDLPNRRKRLKNWKPKTVTGQTVKSTLTTWNAVGKTAENTVLGLETAGQKIGGVAYRGLLNKNINSLRQALNSGNDSPKLVLKTIGAAVFLTRLQRTSKSAKRIKNYMKRDYERDKTHSFKLAKKQDGAFNRSKKDFKSARATKKTFKKTAKFKVKNAKNNIKSYRKRYGSSSKSNKNSNVKKLLNKRKIQRSKLEIGFIKSEIKTNKTQLKFRKRIFKSNKKLFKSAKFAVVTEFDKAALRGAGRKVQEASGNNDIVSGVVTISRTAQTVKKGNTTAQKLHVKERKANKLQTKSSQKDGKLHAKNSTLRSRRENIKFAGKRQKFTQSNSKTAFLNAIKNPAKTLKNVVKSALKKVVAPVVGVVAAVVMPMFFVLLVMSSLFTSIITLNVYLASDSSLTLANQYYTSLTFTANSKILNMPADWENGLKYFGVDTTNYDVEPSEFFFNDGVKVSGNLAYDFDSFKLWAFLCAYYYDFSLDDNPPWEYSSSVETVIKSLWNAEYEFKRVYDKEGYWEAIPLPYPTSENAPAGFTGASGEIFNDGNKTGWWAVVMAGRYVSDGYSHNPAYDVWLAKKRIIDAMPVNSAADGEAKANAYRDLGEAPPEYIESEHWVPSKTEFQQREKWVEKDRLYYTMNRKQSFDSAINQLLSQKTPNVAERINYYQSLTGSENPNISDSIYGGHQTLKCPVGANLQSIRNRIIHINGYDFTAWNSNPCANFSANTHTGIDVKCSASELIYAPANGVIRNVTSSSFEVYVENLPYYAENNEVYTATILFSNAKLTEGVSGGDNVTKGQIIGVVTGDKSCGDVGTAYYLHIKIKANQGSDINVDPLLLFE